MIRNRRNYALIGLAFAALTGMVALSGQRVSQAAPSDRDVVVVNTASQAVPVQTQGVTTVAGDVNVVNTPTVRAEQLGQWNVGLSGTPTVQVGNAANSPVFVRDVDNPARQPFQRELDPLVTVGQFTASDSLTVPAGKRLVIEFATAPVTTPPGTKLWVRIQTTVNGISNQYSLLPELQGSFAASGSDFLLAAQPMKVYADPATQVVAVVNVLGGTANANTGAGVVMSGYLIDVP